MEIVIAVTAQGRVTMEQTVKHVSCVHFYYVIRTLIVMFDHKCSVYIYIYGFLLLFSLN